MFKKWISSVLIFSTMFSLPASATFAAKEGKENAPVTSSATAQLNFHSKLPDLTVNGNGGSATINWMSSARTISWSVKPSFFGPYYYDVDVTVTRMDGSYAFGENFYGLSIGGTHSDITSPLTNLAPGRYYATLTGTCIFDPGYADIAPGATIPIDLY